MDNVSTCVPCRPGSFESIKGLQECCFCGAIHQNLGSTYEHHYGSSEACAVTESNSDSHCLPCLQFSGQDASAVGPQGLALDDRTDCLCFGGYDNITLLTCHPCPQYMFKVGFSNASCAWCANGTNFVSSYQPCGLCELRSTESVLDMNALLAINQDHPELAWGISEGDCSCRLGFERIADNCSPCPLGQLCGSRATRQCGICPADTYTNATGAIQCQSCPSFSSTLGRNGSVAVTDCICEAGFHWKAETLSWDACPPETFRTHQDVLQETLACVACPADHYPSSQKDNCTMCPLNERAEPGSPSLERNCRLGYDNNTSAGACSLCPNGTYSQGGNRTDLFKVLQ